MIPLLVALLAVAQPLSPSLETVRSGLIISTLGHSEWCPPGNVRLDLDTGRYLLLPRAPRPTCSERGVETPARQGSLARADLDRVRTAALRVQSEGILNPECRAGGKPRSLVMTNGGVPQLVLSTNKGVTWAPRDLGCWSEAGFALHDTLDAAFQVREWR